MSIYWRNGWAWARKTIKGIEYRAPLGTRSKREAESAHAKWVAAFDEVSAKKSASFREAVDRFTEDHLSNLKKSSQQRYLVSLLNLTPHFQGLRLEEISKVNLTAFMTARRKEGVSDSTIIRDLACLSSVFTIASDWEMINVNPVLPFLRMHKKRKSLLNSDPKTRYLSHAEELAILSAIADSARAPNAIRRHEKWMMAAAFAGYIDTGLRSQELLVMRWSWVSLERLEITVSKEVAKSKKDRVVPLLPRFARILCAMPRNSHTEVVFWRTAMGCGFDDLNHTFQRYARGAGVEGVSIHDLRRTCGCRLLQDRDLSLEQVGAWLGHASVKTTEKVLRS